MLYDGALKSLAITRDAFTRSAEDPRCIATINQQLLKAQSIVAELQSGLNLDAGGEFAATMTGFTIIITAVFSKPTCARTSAP